MPDPTPQSATHLKHGIAPLDGWDRGAATHRHAWAMETVAGKRVLQRKGRRRLGRFPQAHGKGQTGAWEPDAPPCSSKGREAEEQAVPLGTCGTCCFAAVPLA